MSARSHRGRGRGAGVVAGRGGGGTAGHNGLRSTEAHVGNAFRRVRIGIGHPGHKDRVTPYVLGNYAKAEADDLAAMLDAIAAEAGWLAAGDDVRFMNDVALRAKDGGKL